MRLLATYLALIALSLGLLVWRAGTLLDASRFGETQRDQEGRAILVGSAVEEFLEKFLTGEIDTGMLEEETVSLSSQISQHIVVLDTKGTRIADSAGALEPLDESARPEVANALQRRVTLDIRFDQESGGDVMFTAAPIRHDRDLIGVAQLELPMSAIKAASQQMWLMLSGAALIAACATILVSLWFAQSLVKPIRELTNGAAALAGGDLRTRIQVGAPEELEQLARAFNHMVARIEHVMEDQRAFVADAAHELRTPLTTIRLRVESLYDGASNDPQVSKKFLQDIESETGRLSRLMDQLLDLSRIETGLIEPRRERVSVCSVAQGAANELAERARVQGLTVRVDIREDLPEVNADPDQLRQVFLNLIGNAIKFTLSGGRVEVSVRVNDRGKSLWTIVHDTGIGIGVADLPHIFDRFYRSDKARARETGGSGLGLAIVKGIIDAHGGRIWAESELGKGTKVIFSLPI
jgi:signal transduction histidine kinase